MPDPNPYIIDTDSIIIRNGFFYLSNTYDPQSTNTIVTVGPAGAITYADTLLNISTYGVGYLPDVFSTLNGQLSNLSTTIYNGGIQEPDFSAACISLSTTTNDLSNWTATGLSTLSTGIANVEYLFYSTVYASSVTGVQLVSTGNSLQTQIDTNSTATGVQFSTTVAYMSTNPFGYAYSSSVNALSTYVYSTLTQGLSTTNENLNATASTQGIEISTLAGSFQTLSSLIGFSTLSSQIQSTNQQLSSLSSYVNDVALSTANNTILIQNLSTSLSTTNATLSSVTSTISGGYATGNDVSTISSALSSYATVANICTISAGLSSYATIANICTISAGLSGFPTGNDISTLSSALSSYATILALSNVSVNQQFYVPLSGLSSLVTSTLTTNNFAVRNQFAVSSFFVNGNSNTLGGTNPAFDQIGALRLKTAQPQGLWLENTNNQPCELVFKQTSQAFYYGIGTQTTSRGMYLWTGFGDALNADSNRNVAVALGSTNTAYKFYVNGNAYIPTLVGSALTMSTITVSTLTAGNITGVVTGNDISTISSALSSYATVANICTISSGLSSYATVANVCTISSALSSYATTAQLSSLSGGIRVTYATGASVSSLSASLSSYATVANICTISSALSSYVTSANLSTLSSALSSYVTRANLSSLAVSTFTASGTASLSTLSASYVYVNNASMSTLMYLSGNVNTLAAVDPTLNVVGAVHIKSQLNQNLLIESDISPEVVYYVAGYPFVVANGYDGLTARGYFVYTGAGDAINADYNMNVAIATGSTNTAYKLYVNGSSYASSTTAPQAIFSSLVTSTIAINGTATATSFTSPIGLYSSLTTSTLTVYGAITASTIAFSTLTGNVVNATTVTSPIGLYSSLTTSTLTVYGAITASTIAFSTLTGNVVNATTVTSPVGLHSSLTTSTLTVNGAITASTIAFSTLTGNVVNATTVTSPIGLHSSLITSTLTVNGTANATTFISPIGLHSSLITSTLTVNGAATATTLNVTSVLSTVTLNMTGAQTILRTTNPQLTITNGGSGGPALGTPVEISFGNNGVFSGIGLQADSRGTYIYAAGGDAIRIFNVNRQTNVLGNLCVESASAYLGFRAAAASFRFINAPTSNAFVRAKYTASGTTDTIVASTTAVLFDSINIPTVNAWLPGSFTANATPGTALATTAAGTLIASQSFTLDSNSWNYQSVFPFYMAIRGGLTMSLSTGTTAAPIRWYGTYQNTTQASGERVMKGAEHFTEGRYVTTHFNMYSISAAVDSEKARIGDSITFRYYAQDYLASGIAVLSTPTQFSAFISPVVV